MKLDGLNPKIQSAAIHDHNGKAIARGERISYAARLIYVFSGELSGSLDTKKIAPLGAGTLLYIPAGSIYSLDSGLPLAPFEIREAIP